MREYIAKIMSNEIMTNKSFWKTMRRFLINKGIISDNGIPLSEDEQLVNIQWQAVLMSHKLMLWKNFSGIKPTSVLDQENTNLPKVVYTIVEKYSSYSSVIKLKKTFKNFNPFSF